MKYISIVMCLTILAVWLFAGVREFTSATRQHGLQRLLTFLGATFISIGGLGFFGSGLAAMGAFNWLPHSFEWPIGNASGVVSTQDGYRVVPHTPSGRVQVYDSNWKFLRGWNIDAGAGTFRLYITDTNHINVLTARGHKHYVYDLNAGLLASESYSETGTSYSSFPEQGISCEVPTPVWLWVFTNPFHSWLVAAGGFVCFFARDKGLKRKAGLSSTPT